MDSKDKCIAGTQKSGYRMGNRRRSSRDLMRLNRIRHFSFGVIALFVMAPAVYGQALPPAQPNAEPEQVKGMSVGVDEVSLDLAVKDKHRKPVLDLKPEDIEVTDNGIPVTLKDFRLVQGDVSSSRGHLVTFCVRSF